MSDDRLHIGQHISAEFNRELDEVRAKTMRMGGLVEEQCRNALTALLTGDIELGERVAASDGPVNDLELEISAECTDILARRQPAASDLRMVLSLIRLTADLERVGDEAEKIGRLAAQLGEQAGKQELLRSPKHLGEKAVALLSGALDAFARLDVHKAVEVAAADEDIDREFEALTRLMLTYVMEDSHEVKAMLKVNWCARALERIGDHAVNICEETIFLVEGSDVRHLDIADIRARFS